MRRLRLTFITLLALHSGIAYSQYGTGGYGTLRESTDHTFGPIPKWRPNSDEFAFLTDMGMKVKLKDSIVFIENVVNEFEWSMDGNTIVYTASDADGKLKVYEYDIDKKLITLISMPSQSSDFYPVVSANRSIIAYYSWRSDKFARIYYTFNGSTSKILAKNDEEEFLNPSFSPDGKYLLYTKYYGKDHQTIEIIDFESKQVVFSLESSKYDFYDWSPDSKYILVRRHSAPMESSSYFTGRLCKFEIASGERICLTRKFRNLFSADWSDKGGKIVFSAKNCLYVVSEDGSDLRRLIKRGWTPNFNSSGSRIIYLGSGPHLPVCEIDVMGAGYQVLEANTFETWGEE